jgi:hypothetical protein
MLDNITYTFEEVEFAFNGETITVNGSICVEYVVEEAQDDCGYPGGVYIQSYCDLTAEILTDEGDTVPVRDKADLDAMLPLIIAQLDEDYIVDEIEDQL